MRMRVVSILCLLSAAPLAGQGGGAVAEPESVDSVRTAMAIRYPEGKKIKVEFWGTHRLPEASGNADVERNRGVTAISVDLKKLKPATLFGGDFATYVLWTVSPEGHSYNAGQVVLDGDRAKLKVSTPMQTFGLFVTAEPHFLVDSPSRLIVMRNMWPSGRVSEDLIKRAQIEYRKSEGEYKFDRETLDGVPAAAPETGAELKQARMAIALAERAQAGEYAASELQAAHASMKRLEALAQGGYDHAQIASEMHDVVRLAVDARKLAETRAFEAALEAERTAKASEIAKLNAELSQARAEAEKAREAARQREAELQRERTAREQAAQEAELARASAQTEEEKRLRAEQRARELAAGEARLRSEWERDTARLRDALGMVADTRETARGLVVNLPDILFATGKASIQPQAREALSKICGVLLVARDAPLSIEGHTDSVGSEESNQRLSEARAEAVRDYLAKCGLDGQRMKAAGFGETQPIAPDDTAQSRQRNRRVEIVIDRSPQAPSGASGQ